jgi:hypothetical protein
MEKQRWQEVLVLIREVLSAETTEEKRVTTMS